MISLPIIIAFLASLFFGIFAIISSLKEDKAKRLLREKEKIFHRSAYESTVLKEIRDRIGISTDIQKTADIITASLDSIFPYSTASSMLIKNNQIIFSASLKEPVNKSFIIHVKANCLKSLSQLLPGSLPVGETGLPKISDEKITGVPLDENSNSPLSSTYTVPILVNQKIHGVINLSSAHSGLYKEEDMLLLRQIIDIVNIELSGLEEILTHEKKEYVSLIDSFEDGVIMIDSAYRITMLNKKAQDLLGLPTKNPTIIDLLSHLPNTYNFGDKIDKAIKLNQKIAEEDIQHNNSSLNISLHPVLDSTDDARKALGVSMLIHDTTREKSLSKMKEDFTRIIVHELRSPLTSIKASSEMLNTENKFTDDEKRRLIDIIHNQSDKMLDEVSMILDAAKIDTGVFTVQKTNGDLKKLLEEVIDSFKTLAQNKMVNLTTNIDPLIPPVDFDSYQIRRVLNNLLANSIKFTPGGGAITLKTWLTPEKIFISISDTGSGIPKEKQHLIFSKFAQIQDANATVGTGLGLYISNGIIQAHKGSIEFKSEPGKGTTFSISLPLSPSLQPTQTISQNINPEAAMPLLN